MKLTLLLVVGTFAASFIQNGCGNTGAGNRAANSNSDNRIVAAASPAPSVSPASASTSVSPAPSPTASPTPLVSGNETVAPMYHPPPPASTSEEGWAESKMLMAKQQKRCDHVPVPKTTASPTSGAAPLTVTLDASASYDPDKGKVVTWMWYFEDGTTREGKTIKHTFEKPGTYKVVIAVVDDQEENSQDCGERTGADITVTEPSN